MIRTRIAPSPTGEDFHIGNAYTALINYVFAKKNHGKFIIRIEDTDRERLILGSERRILSSLYWLGLPHDEGPDISGPFSPYRQSERLTIYQKQVKKLVRDGNAYYCFCTVKDLEAMRLEQQRKGLPPKYDRRCLTLSTSEIKKKINHLPGVIRMRVPTGETTFTDVVRGKITVNNTNVDDQILVKSNGYPTYHLAVVVDDHLMKISHLIRGEEWVSSTAKHVLLYNFFGWQLPSFVHLPLLRNPDKSKLSKRKNPVWVSWYRDQGFLPEAILNYLALMGWSHPKEKEIFSLKEFIDVFTLARIKPVGPVFDIEKLTWLNGEYIRKAPDSNLKSQIYEFLVRKYDEETIGKTIPLVRERIKKLSDYLPLCKFFFKRPVEFEAEMNKQWLKEAKESLALLSQWSFTVLYKHMEQLASKLRVTKGKLFMDIRIAITGRKVGPPLFESMEILGKKECLWRLKKAALANGFKVTSLSNADLFPPSGRDRPFY